LFEEVEETDPMHSIWITAQTSRQNTLTTKPKSRTGLWSGGVTSSSRGISGQTSMPVMSGALGGVTASKPKDNRSSDDSGVSFTMTDAEQVKLLTSSTSSSDTRQRRPTWKVRSQSSVVRKKGCRGCRTLVVTSLKNALGVPALLSTYNPNARDTRIWEALRATSAAPTFFEEMTFGMPKMTYLDVSVRFLS